MKTMFVAKHQTLSQTVLSGWVALCLSCLFLSGCDRSGKRLVEKPVSNPLVQKKPKIVKGHLLAGSKKALLRSAQLSPADATYILKGFLYKATASYRLTRGRRVVKLKEKLRLAQGAKGDFHLTLTNSRNKGYEVIWTNKVLYQRMRYRPYRITSHNTADAFRWQQRSFGRWRSIVEIFGSQLALSRMGTGRQMGRNCNRYQITLYRDPQKPLKLKKGTAWKGPVPDLTRGAAAKKARTPLAAQGELCVDEATGLPLKVSFQGRYRIGTLKDVAVASIRLYAEFITRRDVALAPPEKVVEVKREIDAHDAFARKKPTFMLPPPSAEDLKRKRRRRRRRQRRQRRRRRRRR